MPNRASRLIPIVLILLACGDGPAGPGGQVTLDSLYGEWRWIWSCCGLDGTPHTPESTGQEGVLIFRRPDTMLLYQDGVLVYEESVELRYERRGSTTVMVLGTPGEAEGRDVRLRGDTLELTPMCADCATDRFVRMQGASSLQAGVSR